MKGATININDLLDKLAGVEIQVTDRFPQEDMEYCRREEQTYKEAYALFDEFTGIAKEVNRCLQQFRESTYFQRVEEQMDLVSECNERFIGAICGYFAKKYNVTVERPEWKILDEDGGYRRSRDRYDRVPLQYILNSVYEQMGGMTFEEKAFTEVKAAAREAVASCSGKSQYVIKGSKLAIENFYWSHKDRIWERYQAEMEERHRAFFKALSHFEYGDFEISRKYSFLCSGWRIDEEDGVYDKHFISSSVVDSIKVFKNGKVEIEFKDYLTAARFMETYFPGIPQMQAAG